MKFMNYKQVIREIPDFPKPGILFYDLTTLFQNGDAFHCAMEEMAERYKNVPVDFVLGVEARGFIVASCLAYRLHAGFIPVRKPGKLPAATIRKTYDLEYGTDSLEIHKDAFLPGQKVLVADDLLATGGTAAAVTALVGDMGGVVVGTAFLVELEFLKGRNKLPGFDVYSLIKYAE
jgi:adenine phosphoribosyltransferase